MIINSDLIISGTGKALKDVRFKGDENYSTTEQRIGTWKDGKPLYRRVYSFACGNATGTYTPHGLYNSTIRKIIGSATNGTTTATAGFNDEYYVSNLNIYWNTRANRSGFTASIILEYTKNNE